MAQLIQLAGGGPGNDGERIVVQALVTGLPDDYVVVPNIEIPDGRGQRLELDVVVAAPHAVYVVETKAIHGDLFGDDREWVVNGSTRPAPIRITAHKARVLKSFLTDERPVLRASWVEPIVVLAVPPRSLELLGEARRTTLLLPELVDFIRDPKRLPHPPRSVDGLAGAVGDLLRSRATAWTGPLAFNQWEVVETLHADEEMTEYRAANRFAAAAPEVRLHVYSLSQYAYTREALERRRRSIVREFAALQVMGAHENVVGAQDVFDDEAGNIVLVVPEVVGISLGIALAEGLDLSDEERRGHVASLCRAVAHAHEHGVIHRRISPEHVILTDDGGLRLTGFGKARVEAEGTIYQTTSDIGVDDGYAAPELGDPRLGEVSVATDLFGLAAVAWSLWTGGPPFEEGRSRSSVPSRADAIAADVFEVLSSWLAHRPEDRTASIDDLLLCLESTDVPTPSPAPVGEEPAKAPLQYEPGDVIEGRYLVQAVLGEGGFSKVYRVEDAVLEMDAALKLFGPHFGLETMQREIRALRKINHPNVVHLIDAGQTNTKPRQWYLKSEFFDGATLADLRDEGERFSVERSLELIDQLLDALVNIHPDAARIAELKAKPELDAAEFDEMQQIEESGLVHRDIKPQNLIVTPDSRLMVIDFNIASPVGAPVHTLAGTPEYQPPDADLTQWDVTSDLFATGLVLFELITGEHPYENRNPAGHGPQDAGTLVPSLPAPLVAFLGRACAADRAERFATAVEMRGAMQAATGVDSVGVSTTETSPGTPRLTGIDRAEAARRVVDLRHGPGGSQANPKGDSWVAIAKAVPGVSGPAHARRLYDEQMGQGAHHGLLPGRGGRRPVVSSSGALPTDALGPDEVDGRTERSDPTPDRFRGVAVDFATTAGHHLVGWLTTSDYRLPLVLAEVDDSDRPDVVGVLSATTSAGDTRYAAPRGAYLWTSAGQSLEFARAAAGSWRLEDPVAGEEAVAEQLSETEWRFWWRGTTVPALAEEPLDIEIRVEDKDGAAFLIAVAGPDRAGAAPLPREPVEDLDEEDGLLPELAKFLYSRAGLDSPSLPLMRSFLIRALARGDVVPDLGSSTRTEDGRAKYLMLRWNGPQRHGAVAYLWPSTAMLTWRLPVKSGEGREWTEPRSGKNASVYQLKSSLVTEASVDEAVELLDEAVAAVAEGPPAAAGAPLDEDSPRWDVHSAASGQDSAPWTAADGELARAFVEHLPTKAAAFLRELAQSPGVEFPADQLAETLGVKGTAGLAGALSPISKVRDLGRRFPFHWWEGDPSTYAMKPSVAEVFRPAFDPVSAGQRPKAMAFLEPSLPGTYYGFTAEEWERLVTAGHDFLARRARRRQDTDYTEFCQEVRQETGLQVEPGDHALAPLLGDIARRTYDERGVLVTVIVRYKGGSEAGDGFFALAQELGVIGKGRLDSDSKLLFQAQHTEAVFDAFDRKRRRASRSEEPMPESTPPAPTAPSKRDENRRVYAEIQTLQDAGDYQAAAALAREQGWEEMAQNIERKSNRQAGRSSSPGGSYVALTVFLREHPADTVDLSLTEIEEIIGRSLPPSARRHRPWWANTEGNSQAQSWLAAGRKVQKADLPAERVVFSRS